MLESKLPPFKSHGHNEVTSQAVQPNGKSRIALRLPSSRLALSYFFEQLAEGTKSGRGQAGFSESESFGLATNSSANSLAEVPIQ
jgi:hypothetical protein